MKVKELTKALQRCDGNAQVDMRREYFEDEEDRRIEWVGFVSGVVLLSEEGPSNIVTPVYADGKLVGDKE